MTSVISQAQMDPVGLRREEVYAQLRHDILSCTLLPGAELYEGVLAERFDVSKSPIRDALSRLHAERLVSVTPRKGYRVAPISLADASDLFQFRSTLEAGCARLAADRADAADLAALDRFRELDPAADPQAFVAYNRSFHLGLLDLCPNRRMVETARTVVEHFDRLVLTSLAASGDRRHEPLVLEHNAIIDALQKRDGRQVGRLLVQHVGRAEKRVMASLSNAAIVA